MFKKLKSIIITSAAAGLLVPAIAIPTAVFADTPGPGTGVNNTLTQTVCQGANNATNGGSFDLNGTSGADSSCATDTTAGSTLGHILTIVINILSIIVGAIAVIMIIVGGLKYITSGGSDQSVAGAKNTIIYAIVGLVIVALAQVIVHFLLNRLSNTNA